MVLPLRVVIVGTRPAAMDAVGHMFETDELSPEIDVF
jgi:hypothetical protein